MQKSFDCCGLGVVDSLCPLYVQSAVEKNDNRSLAFYAIFKIFKDNSQSAGAESTEKPQSPGVRLSHAGASQPCLPSLWGTGRTPHLCFNLFKHSPLTNVGRVDAFRSDSGHSVTGIGFFAVVLKTHMYIFKIIF